MKEKKKTILGSYRIFYDRRFNAPWVYDLFIIIVSSLNRIFG